MKRAVRVLYIAHPYRSSVDANLERVQRITRGIVENTDLPIAPQLYLPQFIDESTERELAIACCLKLVALCDEVRVYDEVTEGMQLEIAEAQRLGVPVVYAETA